jgi:hypothetical protein
MSKIGQLADRLLSLAVPQTKAAAICDPENYCYAYLRPGTCRCVRTYWSNGMCRTYTYTIPGCWTS